VPKMMVPSGATEAETSAVAPAVKHHLTVALVPAPASAISWLSALAGTS